MRFPQHADLAHQHLQGRGEARNWRGVSLRLSGRSPESCPGGRCPSGVMARTGAKNSAYGRGREGKVWRGRGAERNS